MCGDIPVGVCGARFARTVTRRGAPLRRGAARACGHVALVFLIAVATATRTVVATANGSADALPLMALSFGRGTWDTLRTGCRGDAQDHDALYLVSIDGDGLRQIPGEPGYGARTPRWSAYLATAFARGRGRLRRARVIRVIRTDGSGERDVFRTETPVAFRRARRGAPPGTPAGRLVWSPERSRVRGALHRLPPKGRRQNGTRRRWGGSPPSSRTADSGTRARAQWPRPA